MERITNKMLQQQGCCQKQRILMQKLNLMQQQQSLQKILYQQILTLLRQKKLQEASSKDATPSPDPAASAADHEVIVDMEILPGSKSSDVNAAEIFEKLKKTLQDPQSLLRTGPVGGMLANGQVSYGKPPSSKESDQQKAHEAHALGCMPNMALLSALILLSYGYM